MWLWILGVVFAAEEPQAQPENSTEPVISIAIANADNSTNATINFVEENANSSTAAESHTSAKHDGPWDYEFNGADWALAKVPNNECGHRGQSPIDLPSKLPEERMIKASRDKVQKMYTD